MQVKHQFCETCLSMGTGSAFKDGGLQGDGLKAVLATAMVFGRDCGAAENHATKYTPKTTPVSYTHLTLPTILRV